MNKRRKFLINPQFQLQFISWMLLIAVAIAAVLYLANIYFFRTYLALGNQLNLPPSHIFFSFIWDQYRLMKWIFIITASSSFIIIVISGIFISHRIAGPIYKLQRHFEKISEGKTEPAEIVFRKSDHFKELAASYNSHLKYLTRTKRSKSSE